jgi:pimeloyl-ACP methyl ester carboxylesterase
MRASVKVGPPLDVAVSYLRAGDASAPRVILVHGTPGAAEGWADYLAAPFAGAEVVALDRPGFGASGPAGAVTSLAAQAAAVVALFPADRRPVVLVGHSLGGPVVARAAADRPERVAAVVFLAASLDPGLESIHPMQYFGAWAPVRGMLPRAIRNANAELMALEPELEALRPALKEIRSKVVIVHGTRDALVPVENVRYTEASLLGARCVKTTYLDGLDHFLPWNSQAAVREAVRVALEPSC